ncbi:hypothetical protein ACFYXP_07090 [Streptomyces sp. NPDC002466]|uniref:hypothetical protein n=1 Tax=unclassified Streptomyces TaxID=2593676 RepID=UPI0011E87296|nr:hypothetical protein [Streptomyces sp. sk2.1]TXS71322.1 hypothetical protein EAO76_21565 [Streptomyces sp. sk2.1]
MGQIDTRLIQTAVIGGRDSDQPVILPEQPHNLDELLRQYGKDDFWCGTLLGGCGEPLRPKRYVTRVCHFAHEADPGRGECHRTTNSVDGADHLFVKAHATRWLAGQGHAAQGELRSFGHCHGDAVDFRLRRTKTRLRFELHPEDYRSWRKAADSLGAKEGRIEWVFGRDDTLARDMVARRGYALLVRCETDGNDRRVFIGTVTDGKKTPWVPLELCRMTESGLVTPALEGLRAEGVVRADGIDCEPFPSSVALPGGQVVFAVDAEAAPLSSSPLDVPGRRLVPGFVKPAGSRIVRACLSLPDTVPDPTDQYVYRLAGSVRLLVTDVIEGIGSSWAVRADALVRLNGLEAERTGLWRPSVALDERHVPAPRAFSVCERTPLTEPASSGPKAPEIAPGKTADALRRTLEEVAAKGATITWSELTVRLGGWVHDLPNPARRELLVEVDKPRVPENPLLSVLVVTYLGRPLSYLDQVLGRLGVAEPASKLALQQWAAAETKKTHEAYGHRRTRASAAPPPRVKQPAARVQAPSESDLRRAHQRRAQIGEKLEEAARTRVRAKGARVQRLSEAIQQGKEHLGQYEEVRSHGKALRAWLKEGDRVLDLLDRLIGRPITVTPAKTEHRTAAPEPKPAKREHRAAAPAPKPAKVLEPKPVEKKDPNLRKIRRLLGEVDRTHRHRPTQELLRLLDEIGKHRDQLIRPLPAAETKLVERWRSRLENQRSAERSAQAAAASRNTPARAGRTVEPPQDDRLPAERIDKLAPTVRDILQELARADGTPLNWGDLRLRAGGQLPPLHPDDQVALLVAADRGTPADEPLLSTLVDNSVAAPHRLYRQVRLGLGRESVPDAELESYRAMEALRLRQIWRYRR